MKRASSVALRVIALTIILFVCFAVAGAIAGPQSSPTTAGQSNAAGALFLVCFIDTLVLSYVVLRSRWAGWRLAAAIFVIFFGVATFMSLIEAAVFITRMPAGTIPRLFAMGALIAAPFSVMAVLVLGKWKAERYDSRLNEPPAVALADRWKRIAAIAAIYVVLYFTFGYFIAWRSAAVREYYGGVDEGSFFVHMTAVLVNSPWLVPFQILRALLWVALALVVIRNMRANRLETALAIALLFGVFMNAQLLLPNPYMPEAVRMAHLVETGSSNFLFGLIVGWLLTSRREHAGVRAAPAVGAA